MPTISGKLQSSNTSTWVSAIIAKVLSWGDIAWLLIAFYISAVVIAVTLQLVMKVLPFPFFWSSLQFFASYWLIIIYQRISKLERKPLVKSTGLLMIAVLSNVLGFIFMNVSVGYVKAPFIETVRGMECVSTMILGSIFLSERHSLRCLFTLLPICGGVFLSCQQGSTFDLTGLILLAASNILFSARSVVLRMLQNINPLQVDPYNFYADISYLGLVLLIPITMIVEGTELYDVVMVWLWGDGAYHMHTEELHITTYKQYMDTSYITIGCFLFLVLASTISFAISNCTSLILLHKTDLLSHSVAVVFRRVFTIFVAAFFLGINLNRTNQAGVALSLSGIILYSYFKFAE